ncbi:MAG: alpha-galactosidase [Parvularculaceae bacterium]|nr:alpha-galactosidase [Parvularculaceae bacterium]
MSGKLNRESRYALLHGRDVSVIIETPPGAPPIWRYWGPRLPDAAPPFDSHDARPTPPFSLDADQPLTVFPTFGAGWFHQSALLAHREGRDFAQAFTSAQIERREGALKIALEDRVAGIGVAISIALNAASDVLTVSTSLTNCGAAPLDILWLAAATLPLPAGPARIRYFTGRHNREFEACEDTLTHALWRRDNRRGITSHDAFPGAVALIGAAAADEGIVYSAQLAWSGNHTQTIERIDDGRRQWQLGEWLAPGEVRLAAGETLQAPDVLVTCSVQGSNGAAQNFHRAVRRRMTWPDGAMRPRPVHLNTWEAVYFNHRLDELKSLADEAARIGVERFVLDDGWFKGRDNDRTSLGDWTPDRAKYPAGLRPLADHVIARGMEFGLWLEPEMVSPDSDLYRAHPEWALQIQERPLLTGRHQLVLDLTRAEVADHLFGVIDKLLSSLPVSYLKWDHNRDLTLAGDRSGRAAYHRQVVAAYALIARLRTAHPRVEIEACAGGGGRSDAGILQHTHRIWASDCLDAAIRLSVQRGFLQFLPPEVMGSHIGAAPAHSTGRAHSLELRAAVAATGHFGLELDIRSLESNDRRELEGWIAFYKASRDLIHGGDVWLGEAGDSVFWQAHGSPESLLLFAYRVEAAADSFPPTLCLPMLEETMTYHVQIVQGWNRRGWITGGALFQALAGEGAPFSGAWLKRSGLPLPPMMAGSAAVFSVKAQ